MKFYPVCLKEKLQELLFHSLCLINSSDLLIILKLLPIIVPDMLTIPLIKNTDFVITGAEDVLPAEKPLAVLPQVRLHPRF